MILSYCRSAVKVKCSFKSVSLVAYSFVSQFFPSPTCWCLISSTSHSSLSLLHLFLHLQILPLSHPWRLCWRKPSPSPDRRCRRPGARHQRPGTGQTPPHWGPQFGCSSSPVETRPRSTSPCRPGAPYSHTAGEREGERVLGLNGCENARTKCMIQL